MTAPPHIGNNVTVLCELCQIKSTDKGSGRMTSSLKIGQISIDKPTCLQDVWMSKKQLELMWEFPVCQKSADLWTEQL